MLFVILFIFLWIQYINKLIIRLNISQFCTCDTHGLHISILSVDVFHLFWFPISQSRITWITWNHTMVAEKWDAEYKSKTLKNINMIPWYWHFTIDMYGTFCFTKWPTHDPMQINLDLNIQQASRFPVDGARLIQISISDIWQTVLDGRKRHK